MARDSTRPRVRSAVAALVVLAFAVLPVIANALGQPFYITLVSRVMIFAIAASGVNFALGYVGLVSFGHALYVGLGAYVVGISVALGLVDGWVHLLLALSLGALVAVVVGSVCLRTTGIGFIMITLAFSQMFYYLALSVKTFGGDEGLSLSSRSALWPVDLSSNTTLYYVIFICLMTSLYFVHRLVPSRFGMVIRGCQSNERRMRALGFATLRYKLAAYVISAELCVLSGALLANLVRFASPSYLEWVVSGDLIVMVVLGGAGTVIGPLIGATVWIALEEFSKNFHVGLPAEWEEFVRTNWLAVAGLFAIVIPLALRRGLYGYLVARDERSA